LLGGWRGWLLGASTRFCPVFLPGGSSSRLVIENTQQIASMDHSPLFHRMALQHAIGRRWHFQDNLIGFQVHQILIPTYCIARLLVPGSDGGIFHAFRQLGGANLDRHAFTFLANSTCMPEDSPVS
jgi:hypothetical protein